MSKIPEKEVYEVAREFGFPEKIEFKELTNGLMNVTFKVTFSRNGIQENAILQCINSEVFHHPLDIMQNLSIFTEHVNAKAINGIINHKRRWEIPYIHHASGTQNDYYRDDKNRFWRVTSFIKNALTYEKVKNLNHAQEAGYALGYFHSLISDLDPSKLKDTLPGFHITPRYLEHYDEVIKNPVINDKSEESVYCFDFIQKRRTFANILEKAKQDGKLIIRPIHGDPKIGNIMIDDVTGKAVSIIDLDTVKPGLIHYDIGDCLRSCCNYAGEDPEDIKMVKFDIDLCKAILSGYLSVAKSFFSDDDYEYLYDSIRLIAFELGLRFFTDYLEGGVYFKFDDNDPKKNLRRAMVQFKLTESLEEQEGAIELICNELKSEQ